MMKKVPALTIILSLLLVTSAFSFCVEVVDGVTVPHLNPDPLILSINTPNNSRLYPPNLELTLQFSILNDIGASVKYVLSPSDGWFVYNIDNNESITAIPNVVSREISTVTSHHGGPTQHEITQYTLTIDLHTASEGLHKITAYARIAVFLGDNPMFGDGVDYRPFDPLYFTVGELQNTQAPSPSLVTPTKSPLSSPSPSPIDVNANLNSQTLTPVPTDSPYQSLTSDAWSNQTFIASLLSALGLIVILLLAAFYFKRNKRSLVAA